MRNLDNPELFTQEEKEVNRKSANTAYVAAYAGAAYAAYDAADAAAYDAAYAAAAYAAYDAAAEHWVGEFFNKTGEDKQTYINEVERLKEPWHTLAGETPEKDKRMDMTEDNFYRVLAMNDELIHQQKDEIAKLKQTINKLRMRELEKRIKT